jgi:integrase
MPARIPALQVHRATGQARVTLNGRDVYLGPAGSAHAEALYHQEITRWLEEGDDYLAPCERVGSVADLADVYVEHANAYYVKRGEPTKTALTAKRSLELLVRSGLADVEPADFGPKRLKDFQAWLAADPSGHWSRRTINDYTARVVRMFKWAAGEQLVCASVWHALQAVEPLRRGRCPVAGRTLREPRRVRPVAERAIEAVKAVATPHLAAMIDVQLLSGMRPGELLAMRPRDLSPSGVEGVTRYDVPPEFNKTDHAGQERTVMLGPRGMAILRPWLPGDPAEFVWSPRRLEARRNAQRSLDRQTPRWPSHDPARRREGKRRTVLNDRYSIDSYRRAIERACDRACPPPDELTDDSAIAAWRKAHRWHPHQLRHNASSYIARHEAIEVARLVLGHADIKTTIGYTEAGEDRQIEAALRHG